MERLAIEAATMRQVHEADMEAAARMRSEADARYGQRMQYMQYMHACHVGGQLIMHEPADRTYGKT